MRAEPTSPTRSQAALSEDESPARDHRLASFGGLIGLYAGLTTWSYFAWYYNVPTLQSFKVGGDGWFGRETYAGGADKIGHAWANLALSRGTTRLLRWGGWKPLPASAIASGLSWAFFFFVEVKDGYYYQMSPGDLTGNTVGALLSMALENVPALDRAIDFRVEYFPSPQYRRNLAEKGDVDVAEDYSGQTYLLALHLSAIPDLAEYGAWRHLSRYVDATVGYRTRDYKPDLPRDSRDRRQSFFVGLSLNLQGVIDDLLEESPSRGVQISRKIGHGIFEMANLPYTALPAFESSRSAEPR